MADAVATFLCPGAPFAYPGADVYAWSPKYYMRYGPSYASEYDIPDDIVVFPPWANNDNTPSQWAAGFRIASDAELRTETIEWTPNAVTLPDQTLDIVIGERNYGTQVTATSVSDLKTKLAAGERNILLAPGHYELTDAAFVFPSSTLPVRISGGHHSLVTMRRRRYDSSTKSTMFSLSNQSQNVVLHGIRFVGCPIDIHFSYLIHAFPLHTGSVEIQECAFEKISTGDFNNTHVLIKDCYFWKSQCLYTTNWIIVGNQFRGHTEAAFHSCFTSSSQGALICDNDWDASNRGIVMQNGNCINHVVLNNRFRSIRGGEPNGNEVILMETTSAPGGTGWMEANVFYYNHMSDCAGPGISLYGGHIRDNLFADFTMYGPNPAIYITAHNSGSTGPIIDNTFGVFTIEGDVRISGNASRNAFNNFWILEDARNPGNANANQALGEPYVGSRIQDLTGGNTLTNIFSFSAGGGRPRRVASATTGPIFGDAPYEGP